MRTDPKLASVYEDLLKSIEPFCILLAGVSAHKDVLLIPSLIISCIFEIHGQTSNSVLNVVTNHAFKGCRKRDP